MGLSCLDLPSLRTGLLELPRSEVMISFADALPASQAFILADFLRHFRRGGGRCASIRSGGSPRIAGW